MRRRLADAWRNGRLHMWWSTRADPAWRRGRLRTYKIAAFKPVTRDDLKDWWE